MANKDKILCGESGIIAVTEFDIRNPENEMIKKVYEEDENYLLVDTGVESDICYIFFSSNGLYYPDTNEVFEETIIHKNRYEWKWVVQHSKISATAGRILYVRDIWKRWYSRGINSKADTIDKTIELLRRMTEGYRTITVGSSAGGYMAVLTAVKLNAEYCYNFSGQYTISEELGNPYSKLPGLLQKYKGEVFYFVPKYCKADQEAYRSVEDVECVHAFLFNDSRHASTMLQGNISYIIDMSKDDLLALYRKNKDKDISKLGFLFETVPFIDIYAILLREVQGFIRRKNGKHDNGI